jgi:hypothetical protein
MPKRIKVLSENDNGRNVTFHDNFKNTDMTLNQFVSKIKSGEYPKYHIRNINGLDTPCSNPDNKENNNLN